MKKNQFYLRANYRDPYKKITVWDDVFSLGCNCQADKFRVLILQFASYANSMSNFYNYSTTERDQRIAKEFQTKCENLISDIEKFNLTFNNQRIFNLAKNHFNYYKK